MEVEQCKGITWQRKASMNGWLKELDIDFSISNHLDDLIVGLAAYAEMNDESSDYDGAEDFPIFDAHKLMQEFAAYFQRYDGGRI